MFVCCSKRYLLHLHMHINTPFDMPDTGARAHLWHRVLLQTICVAHVETIGFRINRMPHMNHTHRIRVRIHTAHATTARPLSITWNAAHTIFCHPKKRDRERERINSRLWLCEVSYLNAMQAAAASCFTPTHSHDGIYGVITTGFRPTSTAPSRSAAIVPLLQSHSTLQHAAGVASANNQYMLSHKRMNANARLSAVHERARCMSFGSVCLHSSQNGDTRVQGGYS